MADPILLGLTAGELASLGMGAMGLMQNSMSPQQAQQMMSMQPAPGNPSLAMQAMSPTPMATYNPMMDDPMLMMMMGQQPMAPPRGLLY